MENTIQIPSANSVVKVIVSKRNINYYTSETKPFEEYIIEGVVVNNPKWADANSITIETGNKDFPVSMISIKNIKNVEIIKGSTSDSTKYFNIQGSKGSTYVVSVRENQYSCTCTGFKYHGKCKHGEEVMSPKINKLQLLTFLDKADIIDISTKETTMKQVYTNSYDNNYLQRKLDHYNAWLLDPKRKVEDGPYQGFPEEVERAAKLAKGRAIMEAERAAKPAKVVKTPQVPALKGMTPLGVKAAKRSRAAGPTKQERAIEIYRDFMGQSKDNVIAKIREQLDMSLAGATTYYYNAKKLAGH